MIGAEFRLGLRASGVRPDSRVVVRTSVTTWKQDHPCRYDPATDEWWVHLPVSATSIEYKFRCDGRWQAGPNGVVTPADQTGPVWAELGPAGFEERRREPLVQDVEPARSWLRPDLTGDEAYDVIVIGSGMGGGILAHRLATTGDRRVLVLEAGSYLLPTHVGDGPRAHLEYGLGGIDWTQWAEFRVERCDVRLSDATVGEGMYLGGRSLFWGAVTPRMRDWEFAGWPALGLDRWYGRAERLMRVPDARPSPYEARMLAVLRRDLPEYAHASAPLAIEFTGMGAEVVPSGVFSTADLLIETVLSARPRQPLTVNLNHEVTGLVRDGDRVLAVAATDRLVGVERTFRLATGGVLVLAAGAVGTPLLARAAGLGGPLAGVGLTDHPIRVTPFLVPPSAPLYDRAASGKTLSWHPAADPDTAPYNVLVEIGRDLNQNRFGIRPGQLAARPGGMPSEVSVLLQSELLPGNRIDCDSDGLITVDLARDEERQAELEDEVDRVAKQVIASAGGVPTGPATWRPAGAVSHECGSMRMSAEPAAGVVDPDLRMHGQENVYVCDLSVFPSCPAANPSLTLAALALRLADHLTGPAGSVRGEPALSGVGGSR